MCDSKLDPCGWSLRDVFWRSINVLSVALTCWELLWLIWASHCVQVLLPQNCHWKHASFGALQPWGNKDRDTHRYIIKRNIWYYNSRAVIISAANKNKCYGPAANQSKLSVCLFFKAWKALQYKNNKISNMQRPTITVWLIQNTPNRWGIS